MQNDDDDAWVVVTGKKSSRGHRKSDVDKISAGSSLVRKREPVTRERVDRALAGVSTSLATVRGHPYSEYLVSKLHACQIRDIRQYWVWGLGSIESIVPRAHLVRYQLSLAILLKDLLHRRADLAGPPEMVDPEFTDMDIAVFEELGFATQTGNHEWTISERTLVFAPHFEQALTTKLLRNSRANGTLGNLIFIGNSISTCVDRNRVRPRQSPADVDFLRDLVESGTVTETVLPEGCFEDMSLGAFNDISLHTFSE